jgi:hypothetical protein
MDDPDDGEECHHGVSFSDECEDCDEEDSQATT